MGKERLKCFIRGGYDPDTNNVVVQFSDNSIYEFADLSLEQWLEWRESYPRGTYFNHYYRYSAVSFTRLGAWPENLLYTFIES
jgi:hypothetical protein